jgi:RNA polymerase sigma-70 factor, ECF subfamily
MQALDAVLPGSRVRDKSEASGIAQEFEQHLADGATLAFRLAMSVLHNRADAEDATQEALIRAYRGFHRLRDRNAFRGWLCRIVWRLALDKQRGARRRERRESEALTGAPERTVEQVAVSNEFERHLQKAMDDLPEKLRQALILAAIEGHSTREVAELLGLPEGTVKSRVHLARKQLAEKLQWLAEDMKRG